MRVSLASQCPKTLRGASSLTEPDLSLDVVVVGGGLAGLSAAWNLRDVNVLLLEEQDRVGGRVKSAALGPYWANLGAHVLSETGLTAQFAKEMELGLITSPGYFLSVALGTNIVRVRRPEMLPFRLPLPLRARFSLARAGMRLYSANRSVRRDQVHELDGSYVNPLDAITFADLLGPLHSEVEPLVRVFANRMGGEIDQLTGHVAAIGFEDLFGGRRPNLVGGSEALPRAVAERLGTRVRTHAEVTRVRNHGEGVEIVGRDSNGPFTLLSNACVVATPAHVTRRIVADLSPEKSAALATVEYTPFVVMAMFTDETEVQPWDDVYALAVPSRSFCMLFNPASVRRGRGAREFGGSLVVYSVADRAARLLGRDDAAIRDLYLEDLFDLFPTLRGHVRQTVVQKWPAGVPRAGIGRATLQNTLAAPSGRISYAGDYTVYLGLGMDSAISTGRNAAAEARRALPAGTESSAVASRA